MSTDSKTQSVKTKTPFQGRQQALRKLRALLEKMKNRMHALSNKRKKRHLKAYKKLKRQRHKLKQAFYQVTLADHEKWRDIEANIIEKYKKGKRILKDS